VATAYVQLATADMGVTNGEGVRIDQPINTRVVLNVPKGTLENFAIRTCS
jgi:hypothetical protein